jgi:hypothetical protein
MAPAKTKTAKKVRTSTRQSNRRKVAPDVNIPDSDRVLEDPGHGHSRSAALSELGCESAAPASEGAGPAAASSQLISQADVNASRASQRSKTLDDLESENIAIKGQSAVIQSTLADLC